MTGETDAQPAPLPGARSPLSDGQWHRMHPLTPLLRGGIVLVVVAGIVISNLRERIINVFVRMTDPSAPTMDVDQPGDPIDFVLSHNLVLLVLLAVLVVVLVLIGLFHLAWRFHTFRITGEDVEVRQGVLFRSHRRAPLDRVQGVNLTRPTLARLLGMAKLEVIGAGTDANVKLEYLSTTKAEAVRTDILRLASGRRLQRRGQAQSAPHGSRLQTATAVVTGALNDFAAGDQDPAAVPSSIVEIPIGRLIASRLLGPGMIALLVVIGVVVAAVLTHSPVLLLTFIPMILATVTVMTRSMLKSLRYSIAPTEDGVRISYGLTTTVTEILPPGRIHAVEVRQPLLWRPLRWWSIRVNRLSGRSANSNDAAQFAEVLPVGDRRDVERVLRVLMPGMPEDGWPLVFEHGILGPGADDPYTNTPKRAWPLKPLSWRRNGFLLTERALFLRRGVIWRSLAVFPLARLQSVGVHQGPLDRALGVAVLRAHTIAGTVSGELEALDRDRALEVFEATEAAAIAAGASDRSHRWAGDWQRPLDVAVPEASTPPAPPEQEEPSRRNDEP